MEKETESESEIEDVSDPTMRIVYKGKRVASGKDKNEWSVYEIEGQGETLFIDGELQSCQKDEYIYHEMFVHSLFVGCDPRRVLILGGGEGCTAREVLRWNVKEVVQVDWNQQILDYFQEKKSWNQGAYSDPRLKVICMDAFAYLETPNLFDAIFVDLCDPDPENLAFYKSILERIPSHLSKKGVVSLNAGRFGTETQQTLSTYLESLFPKVPLRTLRVFVPSFLGEWGFLQIGDWSLYPIRMYPKELKCFSFQELQRSLLFKPKKLTDHFQKDFSDFYGC